jgi:hypothetical protein
VVQRTGLAIDHAIGQLLGDIGDRLELVRPVEALARLERRLAVLDPELQAIAVELDLVHPARFGRRAVDQLGELRLDEAGIAAPSSAWPCCRAPWPCAAALLVALPDRARAALLRRS